MNYFDIEASKLERRFFRKYSNDLSFFTGNGKINLMRSVGKQRIAVQSQTGSTPQSLSRLRLRKAISYLYQRKTATRKELERFSHMSSALLGLLLRMLAGTITKVRSPKGLLRITFKGVRFFFSGLDRCSKVDWQAITENGGTCILASFYYLRRRNLERFLKQLQLSGLQLLMDSGEFTAFKQREKKGVCQPIHVEEYASFIRDIKPHLFGYFNLDVTNDPKASRQNFEFLKEKTGIPPIPIWHCNVDDWRESDWIALQQLVKEDHALIGIGATVHMGIKAGPHRMTTCKDALFAEIFRRFPHQNFHWLGGSSKLLYKYPFFSADSSGYLQGRKKQQLYYFDGVDVSTRIETNLHPLTCLSENICLLSRLEQTTKAALI